MSRPYALSSIWDAILVWPQAMTLINHRCIEPSPIHRYTTILIHELDGDRHRLPQGLVDQRHIRAGLYAGLEALERGPTVELRVCGFRKAVGSCLTPSSRWVVCPMSGW